ncbi:FMN-binding protein [Microbacterium sp. Root553]|uniref:FMN-binding protein n=1 Tax=Microbacterium sp. Root553 TaxID=1736556 RepID=UPI0006FD7107|nr:FMN-binding protein [Microbacterium sp. Root553]KQZ22258.1 hypothetical protein ASD43_16180 [Microbacterium sp. Root553]
MIRTTVPTSVRKGAAIAGVAGLLVLAGCSGTADAEDSSTGTGTGNAESSAPSNAASAGDYTDGTYTADGSYKTPESVESVSVTLTIADGVVKDVEVTGDPKARETEQYQGQFIKGISDEVVGKSLDDLKVDRVAGSSLTSGGFNEAVASIKEQAAA